MGTPEQLAALVSEGLSPTQIASRWEIPITEAIESLLVAIGKSLIKQSEVVLTLNSDLRYYADRLSQTSKCTPEKIAHFIRELGTDCDLEELKLYLSFIEKRVLMRDMYEFLAELERTLHTKIKWVLKKSFGQEESGWWGQGVPKTVRVDCLQARECVGDFEEHPYNYTTFIHLKNIIDKHWRFFRLRLPRDIGKEKPEFMANLDRLNGIRNQVMHPVRGAMPTEDDFQFVREMHRKLNESFWR